MKRTSSKGISNSKRELGIEGAKRIFGKYKIPAICIIYCNFIKFYQLLSYCYTHIVRIYLICTSKFLTILGRGGIENLTLHMPENFHEFITFFPTLFILCNHGPLFGLYMPKIIKILICQKSQNKIF